MWTPTRPVPIGDPSSIPPREPATAATPATRPSLSDATTFLGQLPGTVWATDRELTLTSLEGALPKVLGVDPARLLGRKLTDLLLDGREDHPLIQAHLAALDGHDTTVRIEWGGSIYSARVAAVKAADGAIIGCCGMHLPIGWQPDDDLTVRESDVISRRLIDLNLAGIAFGDDQGRITDANDAFLGIIGYTREHIDTEEISWPSLLPVEAHARQMRALDEIMATGRCEPFETDVVRRDGTRVPVLVSAARLSARRREGVSFVMDLSPYRRAERYVRAELAAADALADGATVETIDAVLALLCGQLAWAGAWLWRVNEKGLSAASHHASTPVHVGALKTLAADAVSTGTPFWSPENRALVLPLAGLSTPLGAITLVDTTDEGPEQPRVASTRAIVDRLAKALRRS